MEALGRRSLVETCDVTDNSSIERLLQAVSAEFGSVQILVNCAGRTKKMPTLDFPESDWDAIFETNLKGTLRACRILDRKSTRLNSSHGYISYAGFCLKKKK